MARFKRGTKASKPHVSQRAARRTAALDRAMGKAERRWYKEEVANAVTQVRYLQADLKATNRRFQSVKDGTSPALALNSEKHLTREYKDHMKEAQAKLKKETAYLKELMKITKRRGHMARTFQDKVVRQGKKGKSSWQPEWSRQRFSYYNFGRTLSWSDETRPTRQQRKAAAKARAKADVLPQNIKSTERAVNKALNGRT